MKTEERDRFEWAATACEAIIEGPGFVMEPGKDFLFETQGHPVHIRFERVFSTHGVARVLESEHPKVHAGNYVAFANGPQS